MTDTSRSPYRISASVRGMGVADIGCDTRLLSEAQAAAEALLAADPDLSRHPAAAERVRKLFRQSENSLN